MKQTSLSTQRLSVSRLAPLIFSGLFALVSYFALTLIFTPAAHAATLTINSTTDNTANDGGCTLREAIIAINDATASGGAPGECPAGNGSNDAIILPAGRIELAGHLPTFSEPVRIAGQGMGKSIIDGNSIAEVFRTSVSGLGLTFEDFTIVGFERVAIDSEGINDVVVRRVEIDGTGAVLNNGVLTAIGGGGPDSSLVVEDTYIHDLTGNGGAITAGIFVSGLGDSGNPAELTVNRTTLANLTSDASTIGIGTISGWTTGGAEGSTNMNITNTTIYNIASTDNTFGTSAAGVIVSSMVDDSNSGNNIINLNLRNNTLIEVNHGADAGSEILFSAGAMGADEAITVNLNATNNLLSSNNGADCTAADITGSGGGAGTVNFNSSSGGGNVVAGSTCSTAFDDLNTDQNNIGNFSSTLGALGNNGGYVPTMALLPGSPAIDAGVTLGGVTTDARGVIRPQGFYDTGAYEVASATGSTSGQNTLAQTGEAPVLFSALSTVLLLVSAIAFNHRRRVLE